MALCCLARGAELPRVAPALPAQTLALPGPGGAWLPAPSSQWCCFPALFVFLALIRVSKSSLGSSCPLASAQFVLK